MATNRKPRPRQPGLLKRTRALLRTALDMDGVTYRSIAAGAGVNFWWLSRFGQGFYENPGVVTVETLHNYLETIV